MAERRRRKDQKREFAPVGELPYRLVRLPVRDLRVDAGYQADVNPRRLREMQENFQSQLLLPLAVNRREDGTYWVVDGQHRLETVKAIRSHDSEIEVMLYEGLTMEEEARLYCELNTAVRRKMPATIFHARLSAGEEQAQEIASIAESHGFVIWTQQASKCPVEGIRAVTVLDDVYEQGGPAHLERVLGVISATWHGRVGGTAGEILLGMHMLLGTHGEIDEKSLVQHLAEEDPRKMVQDNQDMYLSRLYRRGFLTYQEMGRKYNYRRRKPLLLLEQPHQFHRVVDAMRRQQRTELRLVSAPSTTQTAAAAEPASVASMP